MLYELELHIICNNEAVRDNILANLPTVTDERVNTPHHNPAGVVDGVLVGNIRYNLVSDLQNIRSVLKGLNGLWALCEPGSFFAGTNCSHDEETPVACVRGDIFMEAK